MLQLDVTCYMSHVTVTCNSYMLLVTCYTLHVTRYTLHVTYYSYMLQLHVTVTCYTLHVTRYMLHVTCYMLHVTCYSHSYMSQLDHRNGNCQYLNRREKNVILLHF